MSKGGSSAPQAPDFSGLINAATGLQQQYAGIMNDQLQFAKGVYNENKPFYQQAMQQDLASQKSQNEFADQQRARYNQLYAPLQEQFVGAVKDYNSPTEVARARGQAMSTVARQYGAAGEAAKRQLQSYGVDPSSARFGALDIGTRTGEAAAAAAAGTQSDVNRENTALGLEGQALNIGNGLPASATASNAGATGAGSGAVNAATNSYSPYASALANPVAFGNLSNNALGLAGNLTSSGYNAQMQQYGANQNSSSGWGSTLGTIAGIGLSFLAKGGRVPAPSTEFPSPTARSSVPTQATKLSPPRGMSRLSNIPVHMNFADGGAVDLSGQQVPPSMSPSGGAQTDDIPAVVGPSPGAPAGAVPTARINAKEFIMPEDVANWIGGKQLQNMIVKARKEMGDPQQAPARPQAGPPQGGPPQGAVPAQRFANGGAVGGAVSAPNQNPMPPMAPPQMTAPRTATPSAARPARSAPARHPGYVTPGAGGGAGKGPAINLGGHQPPRPTQSLYGSPAGRVRSAVPGV